MKNHEAPSLIPRINITLKGDDVSDIVKLRSKLESQLGVRLSIADVVRRLVSDAQS